MRIENALVFRPDGQFHRGSVAFDRVFQENAAGPVLDAKGMYLIPGMVDIHLHGARNADVCDGTPEALQTISQFLSSHGVTSFCAATMTYGLNKLLPVMETVRDFAPQTGARCLGVNLEGPFISPAKKGAQAAKDIVPPDLDLYRQLQAASGNRVRLVDLAPELPGAEAFIREASRGCRISLAHTEGDYDTAMAAFAAGADHVTHLFNAMPPLHHRKPGVIGAAMDANAYVEVICDGLHLHPSIIRAIFRMFPADKICFISDSMRCAGLPDGDYELGGQPVVVQNGRCTLHDGTLAGSSIHLHTALQRAVEFGVPLEKAVAAVTINPARSLGLNSLVGSIESGKPADCVLLDAELNIHAVFQDGILLQ